MQQRKSGMAQPGGAMLAEIKSLKLKENERGLRTAEALLESLEAASKTEKAARDAARAKLRAAQARAEEALQAGAEDLVLRLAQDISRLTAEANAKELAWQKGLARITRQAASLARGRRRVEELRRMDLAAQLA